MENWKSYARCFFKSAAATPGTTHMDTIRGLIGDPRGRVNQRVLTPDEIRSQFVTPNSPGGTITMIPPKVPAKTKFKGVVDGMGKITRGILGSPWVENWKNKKEREGIRGGEFTDPIKISPEKKYPQIPQEKRDLLKRDIDERIRLMKNDRRWLNQGL